MRDTGPLVILVGVLGAEANFQTVLKTAPLLKSMQLDVLPVSSYTLPEAASKSLPHEGLVEFRQSSLTLMRLRLWAYTRMNTRERDEKPEGT